MATKSTGRRRSSSSSKAKGSARKSAKSNGGTRGLSFDKDLAAKVAKRFNGGESLSKIAKSIKKTPGQTKFLVMLHTVAHSPKLRITHSTEKELVQGIRAARNAKDEHSGWGWISARTNVSEGKVKALAEANGIAMGNIATVRASKNGKSSGSKTTGRKRGGSGRKRSGSRRPSSGS